MMLRHPCADKNCTITWTRNPRQLVTRFQHGDNPEHVLEVAERALISDQGVSLLTELGVVVFPALIINWLTKLHTYEEGRSPNEGDN